MSDKRIAKFECCGSFPPKAPISPNESAGPNATMAPRTCRNRNSRNRPSSVIAPPRCPRPRAHCADDNKLQGPGSAHLAGAARYEVDEHVFAEPFGRRVERATTVEARDERHE